MEKLKNTVSCKITNSQHKELSNVVDSLNSNKSEIIRSLINDYINKEIVKSINNMNSKPVTLLK